jgi:synaptobrevin family protein YKT6
LAFPELKDYIVKYQDPQQADSIMKIQKELDETKIVLHKTIESVLQRGEKIDDLVAKSDGLSAQSKMFYSE